MIGTMRMKRVFYVIILFIFATFTIEAQTVDGFFTTVENTSTNYVIKLQIKLESGSAILSIATVRFNYDTTSLSFPNNPVPNKDYQLYNFSSPTYYASVSHPSAATISINIVFSSLGTADTITTDTLTVASISFKKLTSFDSTSIYPTLVQFFSPSSSTLWTVGNWKDYQPTIVANTPTSPEKFELMQNFPNPFNPTTTIKYQIPSSSLVTLKIYNILGQEIATLVNEMQNSGSYTVQFNAVRLASGIYLYSLHAGSYIKTKKMILMK